MANVNNYIRAGNAAVRKAVAIRKTLADNKTDFGALGQESIRAAAQDKAAIIASNAKVAKAATNAAANIKLTNIEIDRDKSIDNSVRSARKAGKLAGGAALLGIGAMKMRQKTEPNEMLGSLMQQMGTYDSRIEDLKIEAEKIRAAIKKPTSVPANTKPDQGESVSTNISAQQSANSSGVMSKGAIRDLAISQGFSPQDAAVVVGIAGGESGYDPSNSTRRLKGGLYDSTGEDSVGLMQINWGYHKDRGWLQKLGINSREDLFDPVKNMKAAKYLHDASGGFVDWTVYNEGIYKNKM